MPLRALFPGFSLSRPIMHPELIVTTAGAAAVASACLTGVVRRYALSHSVLDVPNERSSHTSATPRGGGVAVVVTVTLALAFLAALHMVGPRLCLAVIGGGTVVALIGYLDDRYHVSPKLRLLVHFAAATWAVVVLRGIPPLRFGSQVLELGWLGNAIAAICIVWMLNLFNFMDGIDGIAASEAVFVACSGSVLGLVSGTDIGVSLLGIVFGSACIGFLVWNWPPAKIFMGDVGSGYMGYFIGVFSLAEMRTDPAAPWIWLILAGVFVVDATLAVVRRMARGERIDEPHRTHAYQRLARLWNSHQRVTVAVMLVNLLWLLPCAILASLHAAAAAWIAFGALTPLAFVAFVSGSGRAERRQAS